MIHLNKAVTGLAIIIVATLPLTGTAQTPKSKEWVTRSNSYTKLLIDIDEKYSPEFGSNQGLAYYDTLVSAPTLANMKAERRDREHTLNILKQARQKETDPAVKQDLEILINQTGLGFRRQDFAQNREVPFINAAGMVYRGLQPLLDDQTPAGRRASAVIRLRKYAGLQKGYRPVAEILKDRTRLQLAKPGMIYPSKQEMEVTLAHNASIISGIEELFKKYNITG